MRRRLIVWTLASPLLWLGFVLLISALTAGLAALILGSPGNRGAASAFDRTATSLSRVHVLSRFATAPPMLDTLRACESLGKWALPVSGLCGIAHVGASGTAAITTTATGYRDITDDGVIRNQTLNLPGLRGFVTRTPSIDTHLRDVDDVITRVLAWQVLPASWEAKLQELDDTVWRADSVVLATPALVGLVDAEKPARFFVGLTSQAETRGGGGLLGMYAIVSVRRGVISIDRLGSNLDLPEIPRVPRDLNAAFYALFGTGNPEWQNLNVAPDGPTSGRAWLSAWRAATGERLDGAVSIDTFTLGRLCAAAGVGLRESGGRALTSADEIADYASFGVYTEFPDDDLARKDYQAQVFAGAVQRLLDGAENPSALVDAMFGAVSDNHAWFYFDAPLLEQMLKTSNRAGWIGRLQPRNMQLRFNNLSGNKADFFLRARPKMITRHGQTVVRLRLSLAPALAKVQAPIVRHRLDKYAGSGPGTYLQVLASVGPALRITGVRINGRTVPLAVVDFDGMATAAAQVNVVLERPSVVEIEVTGAVDNLEQALAGALVHS